MQYIKGPDPKLQAHDGSTVILHRTSSPLSCFARQETADKILSDTMWPSRWLLSILATTLHAHPSAAHSSRIVKIIKAAHNDGIDLPALPFASAAFAEIDAIAIRQHNFSLPANATKVDTHAHAVPDFYRALVPLSGGSPTPAWTLNAQQAFMAQFGIRHSVLSLPQYDPSPNNNATYIGMVRLINEWLAALSNTYPEHFTIYASAPLPYTSVAIREANHALTHLKAAGIVLPSNAHGLYMGNARFTPFFSFLNNHTTVIFVHPVDPVLRLPNSTQLISADPTPYVPGLVEFYFETARTFMDLALSHTLLNFTRLTWQVPHVGGSFPSILDRFVSSQPPLRAEIIRVMSSRMFWDSAGPTYTGQVQGLLGYGVPSTQLTFGTDFPFVPNPSASTSGSLAGILNAGFLNASERVGVFERNARSMLGECLCGH